MNLEEKILEPEIEVLSSGKLIIKTETLILKNQEILATNISKRIIYPGDDYSQEIDKIKSICEVVHSQDVIDKYLSIANIEEPSEEDSE
tara:strand:+ start:1563 stop:1829 length:267 start_codon:yes stop_codon:yes gene_type:complete